MINIRDLIVNQGLVKSILGVGGAAADDPNWKNLIPYQLVSGFFFDSEFYAYTNGNVYPAAFVLENGKTYRVKWDGEQRECVAYSFTSGYSFVAIGNGKNIGYPDTGEKFLILYNATLNTSHLFSEEDVESHYVGIWQKVVPQLLLQEKTITENGEYTADAGFDALGKVLVDVASSGGGYSFFAGTVTLSGSAFSRIPVDFGFTPGWICVYKIATATHNSKRFMFVGYSTKFAEEIGVTVDKKNMYANSTELRITGSSAGIEELESGSHIYGVDATGFNIGIAHLSGNYNVIAIG